jgi:hypothetical protein
VASILLSFHEGNAAIAAGHLTSVTRKKADVASGLLLDRGDLEDGAVSGFEQHKPIALVKFIL